MLSEKDYQLFKDWKKSGSAGLTNQAFRACIQTMSAVPEQDQYLNEQF